MQRSLAPRAAEHCAPVGYTAVAPSILIIGNDDGAIDRIRDCVQRDGHRVQDVRDVITALGVLDVDTSIGCVFVDGGSPWFDGLALIERLRKSHRAIPCVLFARNPDAEDVVRAMRLQVADVVTDPEDETQVARALSLAAAVSEDVKPDLPALRAAAAGSSADALEQAYRHGLALIETVRALRDESAPARVMPFNPNPRPAPRPTPVPVAVAPTVPDAPQDSLAVLQAIQRKRAARDKFFPKGLFEDPCWDMLLDLMANHLRGRRISVSSLCVASGVAQTTALRRISELNDRGLVRRIADERDGRRVFVELTEQGIAALSAYVEHIHGLS